MNEETANSDVANKGANRKAYQRELMRKRRAQQRLKKELGDDKVGEVSLASVEKEAVVETAGGDNDVVTREMTKTDAKFEAVLPGYYIFGEEVKERECWGCGGKFETRLELNKFCSPGCKDKWLSDAFGKLRNAAKVTPE